MRGFASVLLSSSEDEGMRIPVVAMPKSSSDPSSIVADAAAFFIIGEDEEEDDGVLGLDVGSKCDCILIHTMCISCVCTPICEKLIKLLVLWGGMSWI